MGQALALTVDSAPMADWDTWQDAMRDWLATLDSQNTRIAYEKCITEAMDHLGVWGLGDISARALLAYRGWVMEQRWKPSTKAQRIIALRAYLRWVAAMTGPPLTREVLNRILPVPKVRGWAAKPVLSDDQLARVLAVGRGPAWWRPMAAVFFSTGIRKSELRAMLVRDVIFGADPFIQIHGKGARERPVYLADDVATILREWLGTTGLIGRPEWSVFPGVVRRPDGSPQPVSESGIDYACGTLCRRANLTVTVRPHVARHTAACRWDEAGMSPVAIKMMLGHESLATTWGYLKAKELRRSRTLLPPLPLPPVGHDGSSQAV